jgi:hypothetical protein
MAFSPLPPVVLLPEEERLLAVIQRDDRSGDWKEIGEAMKTLVDSLMNREAIPQCRLEIFGDPKFAEVRSKSPLQFFVGNGVKASGVSSSPGFVPFLKYFIHGPSLPRPVIEGLCRILNEDAGTSGEVLGQWRAFARKCVRDYGLERTKAATEFFRLGIEIGMPPSSARALRDAVMTAS